MRFVLYAVILGLLFLVPVQRLDVARLEPVQTVAVSLDGGAVVLETDTENSGRGDSALQALQNLEDTTPGVIYLDTAEYLLVTREAEGYVDALRKYLNPSVRVSLWDGEGSVASASKYLGIREDLPKLQDWEPPGEKS